MLELLGIVNRHVDAEAAQRTELAALAEAQVEVERLGQRCRDERRRGLAFGVELTLVGAFPETVLHVQARQPDSGDVVWHEVYEIWTEQAGGAQYDGTGVPLLAVHLEEDLQAQSYFLWDRGSA